MHHTHRLLRLITDKLITPSLIAAILLIPAAQATPPQAETPQAETPQAKPPQAEPPQAETPQAESPRAKQPSSQAESQPTQTKPIPAILHHLVQGSFPGEQIDQGEEILPGLWQLIVGNRIIYISGDGRYLFDGDIAEVATGTNLTEAVRKGLRKNILAKIDDNNTIIYPAKDPKYRLKVFTDTECGYCQLLHKQIDDYLAEGIEIQYLFYPRAGARSKAYQNAVSIWCADDRKAAMTAAKNRQPIAEKSCDNPVLSDMEIAQELGVSGTPTLFLDDGTKFGGYVPPKALKQELDRRSALGLLSQP